MVRRRSCIRSFWEDFWNLSESFTAREGRGREVVRLKTQIFNDRVSNFKLQEISRNLIENNENVFFYSTANVSQITISVNNYSRVHGF